MLPQKGIHPIDYNSKCTFSSAPTFKSNRPTNQLF